MPEETTHTKSIYSARYLDQGVQTSMGTEQSCFQHSQISFNTVSLKLNIPTSLSRNIPKVLHQILDAISHLGSTHTAIRLVD